MAFHRFCSLLYSILQQSLSSLAYIRRINFGVIVCGRCMPPAMSALLGLSSAIACWIVLAKPSSAVADSGVGQRTLRLTRLMRWSPTTIACILSHSSVGSGGSSLVIVMAYQRRTLLRARTIGIGRSQMLLMGVFRTALFSSRLIDMPF